MISQEELLSLVANGEILISPSDSVNISNGFLHLTLGEKGKTIKKISTSDFDKDPREIVVNIFKEDLPLEEVDINIHKLSINRSIIVESQENISLPDNIMGIIHQNIDLPTPLQVNFNSILEPGFDGKVIFKITNPWEYGIYLEVDKIVASVAFYEISHSV